MLKTRIQAIVGEDFAVSLNERRVGKHLLFFCVTLSLSLHLLLLFLIRTAPGLSASSDIEENRLQLRLVALSSEQTVTTMTQLPLPGQKQTPSFSLRPIAPSEMLTPSKSSGFNPSNINNASLIPLTYYAVEELTERPQFSTSLPEDLGDLPDENHFGKLTVTIFLDLHGSIERIDVVESSLTTQQETWLLQRLRKTPIRPGKIGDQPVPSKWTLEFQLEGDPSQVRSSPAATASAPH